MADRPTDTAADAAASSDVDVDVDAPVVDGVSDAMADRPTDTASDAAASSGVDVDVDAPVVDGASDAMADRPTDTASDAAASSDVDVDAPVVDGVSSTPAPRSASTYERLNLVFAAADAVVSAAVPAVVLVTGWSADIRDVVEDLIGANPVVGATVYALAATVFMAVLTMPLSWLSDYRLEHRFGLSRDSLTDWLFDWLKGAGVRLVFTVPMVAGLYALLAYSGAFWWVYAALALTAVSMVMVVIFPVVLLPIFFRFEPLPEGPLRDRLLALAERAGTFVQGAYVWKLGEHTVKANAALAGWGRTRRIIISDTLLEAFEDDEVEVVIAHEIAHQVHRDIARMFAAQVVIIVASMVATDVVLRFTSDSFGLRGTLDDIANLPLVALAFGLTFVVAMPLVNTLSRRQESAADDYALELTRKREAFVTAMEKLGDLNLAVRDPHPLREALLHSHPSIRRRVARARQWSAAAEPGAG